MPRARPLIAINYQSPKTGQTERRSTAASHRLASIRAARLVNSNDSKSASERAVTKYASPPGCGLARLLVLRGDPPCATDFRAPC